MRTFISTAAFNLPFTVFCYSLTPYKEMKQENFGSDVL